MSAPTAVIAGQRKTAGLRAQAARLVQGEGVYARRFDNLILALIVVSLLSVGLEAMSGLPAWVTSALKVGELVVVAMFSLEYVLRIIAADNKLGFIFSFYGLVDLLAGVCLSLVPSF